MMCTVQFLATRTQIGSADSIHSKITWLENIFNGNVFCLLCFESFAPVSGLLVLSSVAKPNFAAQPKYLGKLQMVNSFFLNRNSTKVF